MILSALGQVHTILSIIGFTRKGLISFRESIFHINISSFSHQNNVGRHSHPLLGPMSSLACVCSSISSWAMTLIIYVTPHPKWYDIVRFRPIPHVFIIGFTPKDLISFRESIFHINTSSFLHLGNVGRHSESMAWPFLRECLWISCIVCPSSSSWLVP